MSDIRVKSLDPYTTFYICRMCNFVANESGSADRGSADIPTRFKSACYQSYAYPIIRPLLFSCKLPGGENAQCSPID